MKLVSLLKIIFVVFFQLSALTGRAVTAFIDEKPAIPADLHYEPKTVPPESNAVINWREASKVEVPLSERQKKIITFCWNPTAAEPSADDLNDLNAWLRRNEDALRIFKASCEKPEVQWIERDPQKVQPEFNALSLMIQARLFEADQLAERGKYSEAAEILKSNLKLTQAAVDGDAGFLQYLISCRPRTMTQDAIVRFAARREIPLSLLEQLLTNLPSLDQETNSYARMLSIEFTRDHEASIDVKVLADGWAKIPETNAAFLLYPEECIRPLKVLLDPSLVAMHPKPLDWNSELEGSIHYYRVRRANVFGTWAERNGQLELDHENNRTELLKEIAPLMDLVRDDFLPLDRQAAQKARAAYLAIKNPVGRILNCSLTGFIGSDIKVFQCRTEREATRARLALLIFERRKSMLPASLADLVEGGILKSVPLDLFSGSQLHYSRTERKLWSVSDDGVDDGGNNGSSHWFEKDAVWQIPELH